MFKLTSTRNIQTVPLYLSSLYIYLPLYLSILQSDFMAKKNNPFYLIGA